MVELVASRSGNLLNLVGASRELRWYGTTSSVVIVQGLDDHGAGHLKYRTASLVLWLPLSTLTRDTSDGRSASAGGCVAIYPIGAPPIGVHLDEVTQSNTWNVRGAIRET